MALSAVVLALALLGCRRANEVALPPPAPHVTLPVIDDAPPFLEKDAIVVEVFRDPAEAAAMESRADGSNAAWIVAVEGARFQVLEREPRQRLTERLLDIGGAGPYSLSQRPLLRADAQAPFVIIDVVIEQVAWARIRSVFYATNGTNGATHAIACPLPQDRSGISVLQLGVELSWDSDHGLGLRVLGPITRSHTPMVGDPLVDPRTAVIPAGMPATLSFRRPCVSETVKWRRSV